MGVHRACFFIARAGRAATPERNRSGNQPPILCILPLVAHQLASARLFSQFGDGFTDIVNRPRNCSRKDSFHLPAQGIAVVAGEHPRHPMQQLGRALEFSPKQAQVLIELLRKSQELSLPRTRSVPQGSYSTPHDAGASMANWLKTNIQGFVAETLRDNFVNYVCRDRADLLWQYADCTSRLVDESGKKGWPKLDGPQRGQVHPGLIWPDAVGARPSSRARTRPLLSLGTG